MKIREIQTLANGRVVCGTERLDTEVGFAFASDLMSDVLTLMNDGVLLITGLANTQTIRTAEMADISHPLCPKQESHGRDDKACEGKRDGADRNCVLDVQSERNSLFRGAQGDILMRKAWNGEARI
jgi:hypothetical protein